MDLPLGEPRPASNLVQESTALLKSWPWRLLGTLGSLVCLLFLALAGYQASARQATVIVDGASLHLSTHQRLVGGVLRQAGLTIQPGDEVLPALDAPWQTGQAIVVRRAFPVTVNADGREVTFYGRPRSLLEVLVRAQVTLQPGDDFYVNSILVPSSSLADEAVLRSLLSQQSGTQHLAAPLPPAPALHAEVVRGTAIRVREGTVEVEVSSTALTVGQALEKAGYRLYRADQVQPSLDTPVSTGMQIQIERSTPIQITVDGRTFQTRTQLRTVQELLQEEGISLGPDDKVDPPLVSLLQPGMAIRIVRVTTVEQGEQTLIPFEELQEADPEMELDQYRLRMGEPGIVEQVTRIIYEDGREVRREALGERVVREPVAQIFYYGTKVVIRTLDTPYGQVEYWRTFRVLGTHYFPSTCGKSPDDPEYGITYTGKKATRGIIAVDPRVIPLHTRMYVPGYGLGAAEDTGGKIKGRHIDVCYDDWDRNQTEWDTHYVDIYLLTPVPDWFPYILP